MNKTICTECNGYGYIEESNPFLEDDQPECTECNGEGYIEYNKDDFIDMNNEDSEETI